MPRIVRNLICGQYLHIMSQGINREYILKYDNDKEKYLKLMERYSMKFEVNVIAYCIMSNHVHILVKSTNINNISNFMRMINGNYAMYYNKKYDRVGFVFRSRFKSKVIMSEKSLIRCIKYIHMNPVKAKIVENEEEYKYSSYINFKNNFGIYSLEKLNSMLKVDKEFLNRDFQINDKEEQTYTEVFLPSSLHAFSLSCGCILYLISYYRHGLFSIHRTIPNQSVSNKKQGLHFCNPCRFISDK